MYSRNAKKIDNQSFLLLGPRGVGKTSWVRATYPDQTYIDLLSSETFVRLQANPSRLTEFLTSSHEWVFIDEIQRIPELLNEVHKLIEERKQKFILSGSSARRLRRGGANLLAGRALTNYMFPLTARELEEDFSMQKSIRSGHLPMAINSSDPDAFLKSYIHTYLKEEVQQEGLTRNLGAFSRFLEAASFSQGQYLNISKVAADCSVERKIVEQYFSILEDLLLSIRLPVFTKKSKRKMTAHPKFFFFDTGIYQTLRPKGPLDNPEEIDGPAWETLLLQELRAENWYQNLGYEFYSWQISRGPDVDLVLYGPRGIIAIEVKRQDRLRGGELDGLRAFSEDYPMAKCFFLSGYTKEKMVDGIHLLPLEKFLKEILKHI